VSIIIDDKRIVFDDDRVVRWEPISADAPGASTADGTDREPTSASEGHPAGADPAGSPPLIIRAYEHPRPPSRTPEFLRILPRGERNAMLPAELGPLFSPPLNAISVRQKVNNGRKLEKTLDAGQANIVRVRWDDYNIEGAGRYYLAEQDYDTLHAYLAE
jgi:hypothetical protein